MVAITSDPDMQILNEVPYGDEPGDKVKVGEKPVSKPKVDKSAPEEDDEDLKVLNADDEDSDTEDKQETDEDEDKEEEQEVKVEGAVRPSINELKAAYPDIFKKFPFMKDMYFRELEFTKIFPTLDDARDAAEEAESFSSLRDTVLGGDASKLLGAIKDADEPALAKIAATLLPSLHKISPDLHWKAVLPILENVVQSVYRDGMRTRNEDLVNTALHLSSFLFDDLDIASGKKSNIVPIKEDNKLNEVEVQRKAFETERFNHFGGQVRSQGQSDLEKLILGKTSEGKLKIDPDGVMSKPLRDMITEKVLVEVNNQMQTDQLHMKHMNSLWLRAKKAGYSEESKSSIISAYLARAKTLIPGIRSKLVAEVTGTKSRTSESIKEKVAENGSRKEVGTSGKPTNSNGKVHSAKEVDWSKTSDLDFLSDRVTLKK